MRDELLERIETITLTYRKALSQYRREGEDKDQLRYYEGVIQGLALAHELVQDRDIKEFYAMIKTGEGPDGEQL